MKKLSSKRLCLASQWGAKPSTPVTILPLGQWSVCYSLLPVVESPCSPQWLWKVVLLFVWKLPPSLNACPLILIIYSEKALYPLFSHFSKRIIMYKKPILPPLVILGANVCLPYLYVFWKSHHLPSISGMCVQRFYRWVSLLVPIL